MIKQWILKAFFLLSLSGLALNGAAQKKTDSTMWCFSWLISERISSMNQFDQLSVSYYLPKNKKWKTLPLNKCYWGYQPDVSNQSLFQFAFPKDITSFEITFFIQNNPYKLLVDDIPDTLSRKGWVCIDDVRVDAKQNSYSLSQLPRIKTGNRLNTELYSIRQRNELHRVQTDKMKYLSNESIKIYIEPSNNLSNSASDEIVLFGCGTPGTLYIVQQWINGAWVDYQNQWDVKCVHQKFKVARYIVPLKIERIGIFRVVFDNRFNINSPIPSMVSNPFEVN